MDATKTGPLDETTHDRGTDMPHDRDEKACVETPDHAHRTNREKVRQAHADVERGVKDTERIGTPNDLPPGGTTRR